LFGVIGAAAQFGVEQTIQSSSAWGPW
jgi:hypothetical protein